MSLGVNQNVLSIKTHGTLSQTATRLEKSIEKLSSGLRINRAADDAAGLAISEKLRRQIRGLSRAVLNAQDGISMIQSAEGALGETHSILQRMRELAIESANDTLTTNDRLEIQKEIVQLRDDIDRIANNTEFNSKKLLDGSQTALITANSGSVQGLVRGTAVSGDYDFSLTLLQGGAAQMLRSQIFTDKTTGALAQGSTTLENVAQFYDNNGQFILDSPKTITLNSYGKQTEIMVDGGFTLGYLANQIDEAIKSSSGLGQTNATIQFKNPQSGDGSYIQITSGVIGDRGEITFSGDQGIMNALGMSTLRESINSVVKGTALDPFGNVTTSQTSDSRFFGVLPGIDVAFDSQSAQVAGFKGIESGLSFTAAAVFSVHVVTDQVAGTSIQVTLSIGAGAWTMNGIQRVLQSQINGQIAGAPQATGLEAQITDGELKIAFNPTTAGITSKFEITGSTGVAGISAGTYYSSVTGNKTDNAIVSGISKYDVNAGAANTVSLILTDGKSGAATAVSVAIMSIFSVVANADMQTLGAITSLVNTALANAGGNASQIRMDRIGDSLAFTSKLVGDQDLTTGDLSKVTVSILSGTAGYNAIFRDKLGFSDTTMTSTGSGDATVRMHIVSNTPQFQIGADQGQAMKVSMGNMSSKALGVDNLDMTSIQGANASIAKINEAIDRVSAERSKLGAFQNRLEYAINNLQNTHSNLTSAESRLRDADIAQEMIEFTRNQIVSQSGTAMLAQANLVPQGVLQLLR
ncbi:MAG: hypothetical protein GX442_18090 [Candidatus Riflebacteria bacterium]|nr:hypothetical protein [Candidatus Riflebacteria bacterium]